MRGLVQTGIKLCVSERHTMTAGLCEYMVDLQYLKPIVCVCVRVCALESERKRFISA